MGKDFEYDFSGWATKNNLLCSDGRTIRKDAFKDCDGKIVPLVWQHMHDDPTNVLGHALLENREDGVYTYFKFNDSEYGKHAKLLCEHQDIDSLSIWANQLKQVGGDVLHGKIREVSLVLSGANPGAHIDFPILEHGEESNTEAVIFTGEEIMIEKGKINRNEDEVLEHSDESKASSDKTIEEVFNTLTDEQKNAVYAIVDGIMEMEENGELEHADEDSYYDDEEYDEELDDEYEDEDDEEVDDEYDEDESEEEDEIEMKHNVFDNRGTATNDNYLSHSDMEQIFRRAKGLGSLREAVNEFTDGKGVELMHAEGDYGIKQLPSQFSEETYGIDALFPEYRSLNTTPEFLKRNMDWVNVVMGGVHHTPFTRIKSMFADITPDEARAKGYTKGNKKIEEVFTLLKRTTDPQTIYKKQKLDRDDIIDITDFDVVAWLKSEMRVMLNEEIARAILVGDGRNPSAEDKIQPIHVRPIASDEELYTVKVKTTANPEDQIKAIIRARKQYKGSGNPIFFTTEDVLTEMLLLEDGFKHSLYKTEAELATKLRVSRIVTVEAMENQKVDGQDLYGVIVNLADYNVGTDRGGEINMFDDFDIDYNQQKYLIETRISGALTKPFSALSIMGGGSAEESNDQGNDG